MEGNLLEQQGNAPQDDREMRKRRVREAARKLAYNIKLHNLAVTTGARKEVRRPGKDHSQLFQILDQMMGNVETRKIVVNDVIEEALRFKRRALAQLLNEYIVKMEVKEKQNRNRVCRHCAMIYNRRHKHTNCKGRNVG